MNNQLKEALSRHSKLAFRRMRPGAALIKKLHALQEEICRETRIERFQQWLAVPFSLWPVDVIGMANHLIELAESGKHPNAEFLELVELLGEPPSVKTCDSICAHEHDVKGGNYESLIKAQYKFDFKEELLKENPAFRSDWNWIKGHFDVKKHQSDTGVIRRRMVSERNFRPRDWNFCWKTKDDHFFNVFDAFCHKWALYGMEKDKPLLQKLSVNITPYGTMIVIPRYWSFDCNRDLRWRAITRLHRSRRVPKQGLKLGANQMQRRKQADTAKCFWTDATAKGMRGEKRDSWVMAKLGMHPDTDAKQLRRLLKFT
jgi:hypothetical protein